MRRIRPVLWWLIPAIVALTAVPVEAAPPVVILAGVGIGPVTIGMRAAAVAPTLGLQATPKLSGTSVVYEYRKVGLTVWARDDQVIRVATSNPLHKTPTGVRPGQIWTDALLSVCRGAALIEEIPRGFEASCPFVGIAFQVAGGKVGAISVFRAARK